MNLYLVLAIALGAVSGNAAAPVARPPAAQSAACRVLRAASWRDRASEQHTARSTQHADRGPRSADRGRPAEPALTGAATPRAPALS